MFQDNLLIAVKNIRERKSRVFLTLLGIAIGIMAIVALMGIGEGMQQAVSGELSSLSDTVIVTTGSISTSFMGGGFSSSDGQYFSERDIEDIQRLNGIKSMSPVLFGTGILEFNGEQQGVSLLGMNADSMRTIFGIDFLGLETGEFMHQGDQNKCILGYSVAHDLFDVDIELGNRIQINGHNFVVNGIYQRQGAGMSVPTDDNIHLTDRDFEKITGQENISGVLIRVTNVEQAESIATEIEQAIGENHGDDDYANSVTMASIIDSIQEVLAIIQVVLLGIAAIALVVASIGIMNTMLTSVMERTHEIGIMKAIGARNRDVMIIFLSEGVMISLLGGAVGILLGVLGSHGFSMASASFMGGGNIAPAITLISIALALGVATFVGVISSLYPARKAAKMSPIEAVRYE